MNGVVIESHVSLEEAHSADAVIVGSSRKTREDPSRQLIGGQCSGTLMLAKLGLLDGVPACTDLKTKPWVEAAGIEVLDQPFFAKGNVASAGGCLSSPYLAGWIIARLDSIEAAAMALHIVAPVGEKEEYVARALGNITPHLDPARMTSEATAPRSQRADACAEIELEVTARLQVLFE